MKEDKNESRWDKLLNIRTMGRDALTNRRRILCWKGWQMQDISVRGIYCLIMAVEKEE